MVEFCFHSQQIEEIAIFTLVSGNNVSSQVSVFNDETFNHDNSKPVSHLGSETNSTDKIAFLLLNIWSA